MWIGGFFIVGAAAHGGLFMVYDMPTTYMSIVERLMSQKHSVVVHLNWVSIFLGFHSFGLYILNGYNIFTLIHSIMFWVRPVGLIPYMVWIKWGSSPYL